MASRGVIRQRPCVYIDVVPGVAMNVFLSHKYKAPKVNKFFFKPSASRTRRSRRVTLCSDLRKFEFSVDEGAIATKRYRPDWMIHSAARRPTPPRDRRTR
jgi:hypothetical protein